MEWIALSIHILLIFWGIHIWKKYKDKSFLWLAFLNTIGVFVDIWIYVAENVLHLTDKVSIANAILVIALESFLLVAVLRIAGKADRRWW